MSDDKEKKQVKKNITCYIEESVLDEWRKQVKMNGKFYSGAMEESMNLWIEKYKGE
ncbi:hypothetical protein PT201_08200 [Erysipelothrix rhusiopathiae]|nr:hypothetical protein [Erysipelothrix rhusiopathiae]